MPSAIGRLRFQHYFRPAEPLDKQTHSRSLVFIFLTTFISLLGGFLVYQATNWGAWAFSDSAAYVSAARNFAAGHGFVILNSNGGITPMTEFPPLYSMLLSLFLGSGQDPNRAIRWVNISLFPAFIGLFGTILYIQYRRLLPAVVGMLFCVFSPVLIDIFAGVMSETLFLPLLLALLLVDLIYLQKRKGTTLIGIIVLSALLPVTRYAGILFVFINTICLSLLISGKLKERLHTGILILFCSLLPAGVWFTHLFLLTTKLGGKRLSIGWDILERISRSFQVEARVLLNWLPYYGVYAPPWFNQVITFGALLVGITVITLLLRSIVINRNKEKDIPFTNLVFISSGFLGAYLSFIAFTHAITTPQIDIIDRMLAPILPFIIALLMGFLALLQTRKQMLALGITLLVCILALRFNSLRTWASVQDFMQSGLGYSARTYQESGLIAEIQTLPPDQRMISNSAGFVLYYTNRFPLQINQFANRTYGRKDGYGERSFREKGAALILIYPDFYNFYGDNAADLLQTVTNGLEVGYQDAVGGIYYYPE